MGKSLKPRGGSRLEVVFESGNMRGDSNVNDEWYQQPKIGAIKQSQAPSDTESHLGSQMGKFKKSSLNQTKEEFGQFKERYQEFTNDPEV